MKCCLCGREIEGYGNNAEPVKDGRCCDDCNDNVVLPVRIGWIKIENWRIEELTGYKPQTTFYEDFSIADKFGAAAIEDTFQRSFKSWKHDHIYLTELTMVANHKLWRWYEVNDEYAKLYDKWFRFLDEYCMNNLKGDKLEYYIKTTD